MGEQNGQDVPVRVSHDGAVTRVRLCEPRRMNPQSPALWEVLARTARELPVDTRAVVICGEGPAFSAGLDRRLLTPAGLQAQFGAAREPAQLADLIAGYQQAFTAWRDTPALVVAAVQGHAIGAGFQLALAADLRIVADDVSFCMGEILVGLVPDLGGTGRLVELVGTDRALEICLTGRRIGAAEAVSLGLATLAVPAAELDQTVDDLVGAVLDVDPAAVAELLPLLRGTARRDPAAQLTAEREAQSRLIAARLAAAAPPAPTASASPTERPAEPGAQHAATTTEQE